VKEYGKVPEAARKLGSKAWGRVRDIKKAR
jgi:hypothetical protein